MGGEVGNGVGEGDGVSPMGGCAVGSRVLGDLDVGTGVGDNVGAIVTGVCVTEIVGEGGDCTAAGVIGACVVAAIVGDEATGATTGLNGTPLGNATLNISPDTIGAPIGAKVGESTGGPVDSTGTTSPRRNTNTTATPMAASTTATHPRI